MPAKSAKQQRLMAMVASGKKPTKVRASGLTKAVARKFLSHKTGRKR